MIELGGGFEPSLAMDAKGVPSVSIARGVPNPRRDGHEMTPVVFSNDGRWRSGSGWTSENVGIVPGHLDGSHNSLAILGSSPQLVFASRNRLDATAPMILKMATKGWPSWQVDTLDDDGWIFQAVQRVSEDTTWVVYQDPTALSARLRIATTASGKWETHGLSIPLNVLNSLDAAVSDASVSKPVLGVVTTTLSTNSAGDPGGVHFASSDDGGLTWGPVLHVDETGPMIGPQIVYSGVNPIISYTEVDAHRAKIASSDDGGLSWKIETIATFDVNPSTGLAIDPRTGEPVVAIVAKDLASGEDRLHIARRNAMGNWSLEIADRVDLAFNYRFLVNPRIAVAPDGTVAVAYTYSRSDEKGVRFASNSPAIIIQP